VDEEHHFSTPVCFVQTLLEYLGAHFVNNYLLHGESHGFLELAVVGSETCVQLPK
jgi:hypothetical protein